MPTRFPDGTRNLRAMLGRNEQTCYFSWVSSSPFVIHFSSWNLIHFSALKVETDAGSLGAFFWLHGRIFLAYNLAFPPDSTKGEQVRQSRGGRALRIFLSLQKSEYVFRACALWLSGEGVADRLPDPEAGRGPEGAPVLRVLHPGEEEQ